MTGRKNEKLKTYRLTALVATVTLLAAGGVAITESTPVGPTDESKVPHYFGPNPNWANSPFRLPDVIVRLNGGGGTGATATAEVDPQSGAITSITVKKPGNGYTSAPTVKILSDHGAGAVATALVDTSGTVNDVVVAKPGSKYTAPAVSFTGGGATTPATGVVSGGVDAVQLGRSGTGYTAPTVEFGLPDQTLPGGTKDQARGHAETSNGVITAIVVDYPGSGYTTAPTVTIHDGTVADPIQHSGESAATATATLKVIDVSLTDFGSGYTSAPTVTISDSNGGIGRGATATASVSTAGSVTSIRLTKGGSNYMTPGIRKFTDALPGLCYPGGDPLSGIAACPSSGKYIPLAVPEEKTYNGVAADEYVIGLIQYRTNFSSSLPNTLVRGYVQIETPANAAISQHFPLVNEMIDGSLQPVKINGVQAYGVTRPQWMGPTISATKNKPVRLVFHNLLPTGAGGDLFLPTDSSLMGSGAGAVALNEPTNSESVMDEVRNPLCNEADKDRSKCFANNRTAVHLHGGISPWISDGTPHQWITPAGENTPWPQGVSVKNVPDMDVCGAADDGCQTFYYTNQQSARLMFYHDHAWGTTRLNVYAGVAAGYLISDDAEKNLIAQGLLPGAADTIPLIVQDRTFVPEDSALYNQTNAAGKVTSYGQDPTWDKAHWGGLGNFWYHHVYMPAQNPGDPSGMSAYGRWMYGAWFWPPASDLKYGPIANPYYDPNCKLDVKATWQYKVDPFCEPPQIPGTPNISVGMEQFNDTPIVNGVAYPTVTLQPKTYRLRVLNAANDRFFNFQWYVADPNTASTNLNQFAQAIGGTEVALKASELAAAQGNPNVFPTPDTAISAPGPDWIQIGSEGGFLPSPAVIDGQQVTTWITDPTRFDVLNVDQHSLLLAPAERADVLVDFSKFRGKTLILYNDAPAAFPARVPSYDYYTGGPDLRPVGAPTIVPGFGPNTRTVMQVKIADVARAPAYNLAALNAAFAHKPDGSGVFESSQHPIIVGQAAYNAAYGTNFVSAGNCNVATNPSPQCDGMVRVGDTAQFSFNTLTSGKLTLPLQPKAIHDEMNSTMFDEFGRMQATLGMEASPPTPGLQNVTLFPFINPPTEIIDGTHLPKAVVAYNAMTGLPDSEVKVEPISTADDGSQIWRVTHNGVDTHPIHFHLYDVQVLNRVTWDDIIILPDANELGWKDTVRMSPLEDTIVALRPVIPQLPFELPNSVRPLNPMMPMGSTAYFNNVDPAGNPTANIINEYVNFGWEYVFHCHILSHEEMDMMRPVSAVVPPQQPTGLTAQAAPTDTGGTVSLSWSDNSIADTAYVVQRSADNGVTWSNVTSLPMSFDPALPASDPASPGYKGARTYTDSTVQQGATYLYKVVAQNKVGYGKEFPSVTASSYTDTTTTTVPAVPPAAPSNATVVLVTTANNTSNARVTFKDNAANEAGFVVERSEDSGANFAPIGTLPAWNNTTRVPYVDATVEPGKTYVYRVASVNGGGIKSDYAQTGSIVVPVPAAPAAPSGLALALQAGPRVRVSFTDNALGEAGFIIERSSDGGASYSPIGTAPARNLTGAVTYFDTAIQGGATNMTYLYRVAAYNAGGNSAAAGPVGVVVPALPAAPSTFAAAAGATAGSVALTWSDNSTNETGFTIQRADDAAFATNLVSVNVAATAGTGVRTRNITGLTPGGSYYFRIRANNGTIIFTNFVNATPFPVQAK